LSEKASVSVVGCARLSTGEILWKNGPSFASPFHVKDDTRTGPKAEAMAIGVRGKSPGRQGKVGEKKGCWSPGERREAGEDHFPDDGKKTPLSPVLFPNPEPCCPHLSKRMRLCALPEERF